MKTKTDLYSKLTNKIVYDGIVYDPYGNKQFRYILWIGNGKGIRIALNENEEYLFMDRFGNRNEARITLEDELTIILYNKFEEDNNLILNLIKRFANHDLLELAKTTK